MRFPVHFPVIIPAVSRLSLSCLIHHSFFTPHLFIPTLTVVATVAIGLVVIIGIGIYCVCVRRARAHANQHYAAMASHPQTAMAMPPVQRAPTGE